MSEQIRSDIVEDGSTVADETEEADDDEEEANGENNDLSELTWEKVATLDNEADGTNVSQAAVELARLLVQPIDEGTGVSEEAIARNVDILRTLVSQNPGLCMKKDRRDRVPLHVALLYRAPLPTIKMLADAYPAATLMRFANKFGTSLLDCLLLIHLAGRDADAAFNYLVEKALDCLRSTEPGDGMTKIRDFFRHVVKYAMPPTKKVDVAERLLAEFPNITKEKKVEKVENCNNFPFLLHYAAYQCWPYEVLELIVCANPRALEERNNVGNTPLHLACGRHPSRRAVYELLMAGDVAWTKNRWMQLPLHLYLEDYAYPQLGIVQLLVEANPGSLSEVSRHAGLTPLAVLTSNHNRRETRNEAVIRYLVERNPDSLKEVPVRGGCTPFHEMCRNNMHELSFIQSMVEACPDSVKAVASDGKTPLHAACRRAKQGHLPVILFVAHTYPEALTMNSDRSPRLDTPLDFAICSRSSKEVISALAAKCPDLVECTYRDDFVSRLHSFCSRLSAGYKLGSMAWTVGVLEALACSEQVVLAADSKGTTPLHLLSSQSIVPREALLQVHIDKCPEQAAQAVDNSGRTPLHDAMLRKSVAADYYVGRERLFRDDMMTLFDVVACLLETCPDAAFAADNDGVTPLMLACERNVALSTIYQLVCVNPARLLGRITRRSSLGKRKRSSSY